MLQQVQCIAVGELTRVACESTVASSLTQTAFSISRQAGGRGPGQWVVRRLQLCTQTFIMALKMPSQSTAALLSHQYLARMSSRTAKGIVVQQRRTLHGT